MKPLTSDSLGGYIPPWVPNLQEQNSPVSPIFNPFANETIYLPYLIFHGEVAEKTELIWQLKHSGWFFKPYYPQKLFCYNNICPILNIQQKSLPYLSLLNRKFFDIDYIEASKGKCYMQALAALVLCNGKPIDGDKLSKLNYRTLHDPEKYRLIISTVEKIFAIVISHKTSKAFLPPAYL